MLHCCRNGTVAHEVTSIAGGVCLRATRLEVAARRRSAWMEKSIGLKRPLEEEAQLDMEKTTEVVIASEGRWSRFGRLTE